MTAIEKLVNVAKGEVGYLEKKSKQSLDSKTANAGMNNYTKYARDLDALGVYSGKKNGYSWCDVFVDWCFVQAFGLKTAMEMTCQPVSGGYGASCTRSSGYYKNAGRFYKTNPKVGDQIFFQNEQGTIVHTGIVVNVDSNKVYTIEGNTSSDKGVVENGGSVNYKNYAINYNLIYGYGRPNYSLVKVDTKVETKIEEEGEDMDIEKFKELYAQMRQDLQDNDCGTWSNEARKWSVKKGLINGGGTTDSGEPNYMWQDFLTREQAVTLFYRFAQLIGKA